jgi:hypothetical protein
VGAAIEGWALDSIEGITSEPRLDPQTGQLTGWTISLAPGDEREITIRMGRAEAR